MSKREISLNRAAELKSRIDDYLAIRPTIKKGIEMQKVIEERKLKILEMLNATEENWKDYKWQLRNRISDVETLSNLINLSDDEKKQVEQVGNEFRWSISPYYASLIDPDDKYDSVKLQSVPSIVELVENTSETDPMSEEYTNPAGSITRRYPDRLIINVTNECAMYCRHCQRRRNIGGTDMNTSRKVLQESIDYIAATPEIRDVLITGGDALALTDSTLEFIISQLYDIPHVEFIRLGTRMPVTMPQRVTDDLVNMLKKYHPIYLNTHFNHPQEVTLEAKQATERLANAGISIGN
ncbi:MAG: KamA family radical SAM protein, partial [Bacillota bacterium]|nr:KamA family radical SAM protein [Bacillota bacterium]